MVAAGEVAAPADVVVEVDEVDDEALGAVVADFGSAFEVTDSRLFFSAFSTFSTTGSSSSSTFARETLGRLFRCRSEERRPRRRSVFIGRFFS